jgi:hypothetical protein
MKLLNIYLLVVSVLVLTYTVVTKKDNFTLKKDVVVFKDKSDFELIKDNSLLDLSIDSNKKIDNAIINNYLSHVIDNKDCNVSPESDLFSDDTYDVKTKIALKKIHQFLKLNALKYSLQRINQLSSKDTLSNRNNV